ncbi:MAG: hypothetical protein LAP85_01380 [Acidobacteriia bacterium]|nr:hypothetical protein [Terriglobia bacterium]
MKAHAFPPRKILIPTDMSAASSAVQKPTGDAGRARPHHGGTKDLITAGMAEQY